MSRCFYPTFVLVSVVCSGLVVACASEASDGQREGVDGSGAASVAAPDVVLLGRTSPDLFVRVHDLVTRLGHGALAGAPLATPGGWSASPRATQLAQSDDGRQALSDLVACALPTGWEIDVVVEDQVIPVLGEVGLAPAWVVWPLDRLARRWVSACVTARLASDAVASVVSLRGPHPALAAEGDERAAWDVQEGAFWGDLFTPVGTLPTWAACRGTGWAGTPLASGLADRGCTQPDLAHPGLTLCGFRDAGDCALACRAQRHGSYRGCAAPGQPARSEVVTSYVLP